MHSVWNRGRYLGYRRLVMARKKSKYTAQDRMLQERGVKVAYNESGVGRGSDIPVVGVLSKATTPADWAEFRRRAGIAPSEGE